MRLVIQRVSRAKVSVAGETVGGCGAGLLVLLGIGEGDDDMSVDRAAAKVARLRIFEDDEARLDRSLLEVGGEALVVSQFTLLASTAKGNRPSYSNAAPAEIAEPLIERFCEQLRAYGVRVETGVFGARMAVELVNDGPVTILLEV